MENEYVNPTREMDESVSVACPGPDCDCPSCIDAQADHCIYCRRAIGDVLGQELLGEETEDGPVCFRCVALRPWRYRSDQEAKEEYDREVEDEFERARR